MIARVSVVIPTYNHAHFLTRALQSVVDQTVADWEALVVDNHSEDDTEAVVRGFGDPRIRLLKVRNGGVIGVSRNLGVREASGEWVAFLDSDDCWYPDKLRAVLDAGSRTGCQVVSHDERKVDIRTGATAPMRYGPYERDFYKVMLLDGCRLSTSATTVHRPFLLEHGLVFSEAAEHATVEDYGLWLELARAGARFEFLHDVLGEFVVHGSNTSAAWARHSRNLEALLRRHVFEIQQFDADRERVWRQVEPRLALQRVQHLLGGARFSAAAVALRTCVTFPVGTLRVVSSRLRRHAWERQLG